MIGAETDAELLARGVEPAPWREPDEDATATINYTSGTTARPKGVAAHASQRLDQRDHVRMAERRQRSRRVPAHTADVPLQRLGHDLRGHRAWVGTHIVLRKVDGAEILRRVERHGVTLMCGAPAVANAVLDAAATWDGPIPGNGRVRIVVAGAPPPTRTIERIESELGWEFVQIYGLTETSPLAHDEPPPRGVRRPRRDRPCANGSVAPARPRSVCASASTRKARCWRGSNVVFEGYWEQPDATAAAIVDDWFHTGDGGALDDEGYVSISDRKKDVIISGGENVSSIEVEDALCSHPEVAEAAVIGVPDEKWGETVKALVVLAPGATIDERRAHGALPRSARALQVPDVDRAARRAHPHRHGQAPEVQAA